MDEIANSLNVKPKTLYAFLALILIAIVYQYNPTAGTILGLIAIVSLLTN